MKSQRSVPTSTTREIVGTVAAPPESSLRRLVELRVPDLIEYQDAAYAREYVEFVERTRRLETECVDGSAVIAEAVARNLHKLMAYKDEYEVARLWLHPEFEEAVLSEFSRGVRLSYHLHPPVLRALGLRRKMTFGPWFKVVFRLLRAMRRLRGSRLDLFGYTRVRREERRLIREYRESMDAVLAHLTPDNAALVARIADLPDLVRGYEEIKLVNIDLYRHELAALRLELEVADPEKTGRVG